MSALHIEVAPGVFRPEPEIVAPIEHAWEVRDALIRMTVGDVLEELGDAETVFGEAIRREDEAAIGRIVLGVRQALAERLADRGLFGEPLPQRLSAEQAATLALAAQKAAARRFDGAPITGFGSVA